MHLSLDSFLYIQWASVLCSWSVDYPWCVAITTAGYQHREWFEIILVWNSLWSVCLSFSYISSHTLGRHSNARVHSDIQFWLHWKLSAVRDMCCGVSITLCYDKRCVTHNWVMIYVGSFINLTAHVVTIFAFKSYGNLDVNNILSNIVQYCDFNLNQCVIENVSICIVQFLKCKFTLLNRQQAFCYLVLVLKSIILWRHSCHSLLSRVNADCGTCAMHNSNSLNRGRLVVVVVAVVRTSSLLSRFIVIVFALKR